MVLALPVLAQVLPADPSGGDPMVLIQLFAEKLLAGDWRAALFLLVIGVTFLVRAGAAKWWPSAFSPGIWWHDALGVMLSLVTALVIFTVHAVSTGTPFSGALMLASVGLSWTASGGWAQVKKGLLPLFSWLLSKIGVGKGPAAAS